MIGQFTMRWECPALAQSLIIDAPHGSTDIRIDKFNARLVWGGTPRKYQIDFTVNINPRGRPHRRRIFTCESIDLQSCIDEARKKYAIGASRG